MDNFTDDFGALVTANDDGTWSRGGVTVGPCDQAQALFTFNGMAPDGWVPPLPPQLVPTSVALWQAKAALDAIGLLAKTTDAVKAIGGNPALAWEYGNTIDRDSPTVAVLAVRLGLKPTDLDKLFITAAGISI